jgi:hypothetical protein
LCSTSKGTNWKIEQGPPAEALASYNYDNGNFNEGGEVLVETEDLTPIGLIGRDGSRASCT